MRTLFRKVMVGLLLVSAAFAAWAWMKPYAWGADGSVGCRVVGCQVKQDRSNYWLDVHLKVAGGHDLDLARPLVLAVAGDVRVEPADLTMQRSDDGELSQVWLKFWLEGGHFEGPVDLLVNGGLLNLRSGRGVPELGGDGVEYFTSNGW